MPQSSGQAQQIKAILNDISGRNADWFVRHEALGPQLDFSHDQELYEEFIAFSASVVELPWETLPGPKASDLLQSLQDLSRTSQKAQQFEGVGSGVQDPKAVRDRRAQDLREKIEAFQQSVIPLLGFLHWDVADTHRKRVEEVIKSVQVATAEDVKEISTMKDEASNILDALRRTSANSAADQEAQSFREAAQRYERASRKWLWASVSAALVTIGAAFGLVLAWAMEGEITDADVLQLVLAKAAMLAVLTYGTVTAVRLYRSNAHLAATNRHREDALRTFQTFVGGTASQETKDQVLLAAARAAFGQTPTGLVSDKGDGGSMLEVLSGIANNVGRRS